MCIVEIYTRNKRTNDCEYCAIRWFNSNWISSRFWAQTDRNIRQHTIIHEKQFNGIENYIRRLSHSPRPFNGTLSQSMRCCCCCLLFLYFANLGLPHLFVFVRGFASISLDSTQTCFVFAPFRRAPNVNQQDRNECESVGFDGMCTILLLLVHYTQTVYALCMPSGSVVANFQS